MARRDNRLAIANGPSWTDAFRANEAGGTDGPGARELLITCASDSAFPIEYRFVVPGDPVAEQAQLKPGDSFRVSGVQQKIMHVTLRGVGGAAIGGVEESAF